MLRIADGLPMYGHDCGMDGKGSRGGGGGGLKSPGNHGRKAYMTHR